MHHGHVYLNVLVVMLILVSGALTKKLSSWTRLPYTILLLVFGLCAGLVIKKAGGPEGLFGLFHLSDQVVVISPSTIIFVFLPALIFESAFCMDAHVFRKNLGAVVTFAGPALVVSTLLTALLMIWVTAFSWHWGWITALVFGALISATDPVAVVAILKELGVSKRLGTLIEGESLLNDGTAIVLFSVLFAMLAQGQTGFELGHTLIKFISVVAGGIFAGLLLSIFFSRWIGRIFNDPLVEITLTIALGYFCMLIAEGMLHVSGVMAIVVSGLYMGSTGRTKISPEVYAFLHHFWELAAYIANTLIFFLVGLVIANHIEDAPLSDLYLIVAAYLGIMGIRFFITFLFLPAVNRLGENISFADATLLSWGGLRGAVSLALALIISQETALNAALRDQILLVTVGVVFLSIIVNGSTMGRLLKFFGFDVPPLTVQMANTSRQLAIIDKVKDFIHTLSQSPGFRTVSWGDVKKEIYSRSKNLESSLQAIRADLDSARPEKKEAGYWLQTLQIERNAYWDAFAEGTLSERAVRMLNIGIDNQADRIARGQIDPPDQRTPEISKFQRWMGKMIRSKPFLYEQLNVFQFENLGLQYDLSRGESFAAKTVLGSLDNLKDIDPETKNKIINTYSRYRLKGKARLEEMRNNLPEVTRAIETRIASRIALNVERELYVRMMQHGEIDEDTVKNAINDIEKRMKSLLHVSRHMPLPDIKGIIAQIPMFASFTEKDRKAIADLAAEVVIPRDEYLFKENDRGDSLYIILRGAIAVSRQSGKTQVPLAVLGGGEILGEMALLSGTNRTASARAVTNVTAITINKQAFDELTRGNRELKDEIWRAYTFHEFDNIIRLNPQFDFLDMEHRSSWLSSGTSIELAPGADDPVPKNITHVFIVHGSADFGDGEIKGPAFIRLSGINSVTALDNMRIVWLPDPQLL